MTKIENAQYAMARCYDCGGPVDTSDHEQYVMVRRQTSGGSHNDGGVYPGDFSQVVVHRDRARCGDRAR